MASLGARRVEVPVEIQGRQGVPRSDYSSAFELPIGARRFLTPEQWARATFEKAPAVLRLFLALAWRYGLGLELGARTSPDHVQGWLISSSGSDSITLEARSRLMVAQNIVAVSESTVVLVTVVQFSRRAGRALWAVATPVHVRVIPYLLQRAWT
jgi:Protein of unknown function (DUF2867)